MVMNERIIEELEIIVKEIERRDNLSEIYARYSNRLAVESDCGNDEEEYKFLLEIVSLLKSKVVLNFMNQNGYCINEDDEWKRWKRME